jgi:ribulose-5-phosphate 4-epimerase/fuculose-1-phosphate aldolase
MTAIARAPSQSSAEDAEWQLRCDLAAVFRVAARFDWCAALGNAISAALPGARFLINPRDLLFREITASALIVRALDDGAFPIHARLHRARDNAACVLRVQPRYLTALSLIDGGRMALAHHNNLRLNDRIVYDADAAEPTDTPEEGERLARVLGEKSILLTAHHGVTVVGASVHEAFGECATAEHTTKYQLTAMAGHQGVRELPERGRLGYTGPWGKYSDARMLLDAWRRVLDQEEPDYAT